MYQTLNIFHSAKLTKLNMTLCERVEVQKNYSRGTIFCTSTLASLLSSKGCPLVSKGLAIVIRSNYYDIPLRLE